MKIYKIVLVDPCAYTPDYDVPLLKSIRKIHGGTCLYTSDFYHRPFETENKVEGRYYFFLRFCRKLKRKAERNKLMWYLSYLIMMPEYVCDWGRFILFCMANRPLVHFQWIIFPPIDIMGLFILRAMGIRIVYTVHNPLPHDKKGVGNRFIYGLLYGIPKGLILHSKANLEEFVGYFPKYTSKAKVVPFGLPFEDIPAISREEARKRLLWANDETIFVFQGNIHKYKGLDVLLEAITTVDVKIKIRLIISGSWRGVDKNEYALLLNKASLKFPVNVVDGVPEVEEFRDMACGCDAWVLPYRQATTSFTGMAAMRFGAFVIATRTGSFPEMLEGWSKDWLIPPNDVAALKDAIERFLKLDKTIIDEMRRRLYERSIDNYGWGKICEKTLEVYHSLS
jgi:glycosyltransferase involved in cell wall biosynthesis